MLLAKDLSDALELGVRETAISYLEVAHLAPTQLQEVLLRLLARKARGR